jgi:hypothetical protein
VRADILEEALLPHVVVVCLGEEERCRVL